MGQLVNDIAALQDYEEFASLNWKGTFEDYLGLVKKDPGVTRTSFQRLYDMVLSYGSEKYQDNKKKIIHYNFFDDPLDGGYDSIFGLDIPLMRLVNVLKSCLLYTSPSPRD